jgi:hypothetical protein
MCKVSELEESGGSIFPWKNYTIPLQLYRDVNLEIAVTKYSKCKDLGVSAFTTRKKPIGQNISDCHLMLKSLDSAVLNRLKVS